MTYRKNFLITIGVLALPGAAEGQAPLPAHASMQLGLAEYGGPAVGSRPGLAVGHPAPDEGFSFGFGASPYGISLGFSYTDYYDGYYGDEAYDFEVGFIYFNCWDPLWYLAFPDCAWHHYPTITPGFAWWGGYRPWWNPHYVGWPSRRYLQSHRHRYAYYRGPFHRSWGYGYPRWGWYSGYGHWAWDDSPDYGYASRWGYVSPYGYRSGSVEVVRRSPLFGPRYKESPRVYVTDNGPERPTSRAVPRNGTPDPRGVGVRDRRGNRGSGAEGRTARPRVRVRPESGQDTRTPSARARPQRPQPSAGSAPRGVRPPPSAGTTPPKARVRPAGPPKVRPPASRPSPSYRTSRPPTAKRSPPKVRRPPTAKRSPPKVRRPPTTKRSPPKVRRPPTAKRSPPKVRRPPTAKRSPPKVRRPPTAKRSPPKVRRPPTTKRSPPKVRRPPTTKRSPPKVRRPPTAKRPSRGRATPPTRKPPRRGG